MQWIPSSCPCRLLPCCVCWLAGCSSCPAMGWAMDTWTEYALNAFYFSIWGAGAVASACVFQKLERVPVAWCTRWRSLARLRRKKQQCQPAKKLRLKLEDWTSCQQRPPSRLYPVLSLPPVSLIFPLLHCSACRRIILPAFKGEKLCEWDCWIVFTTSERSCWASGQGQETDSSPSLRCPGVNANSTEHF